MFGIIQTLVLRGSVNRVYELMGIDSSLRVFFNVWGVIAPLIILAFGILCKKYSGKPEKAKHIIIMGFAYLGLQIAGILMNIQLYIQMLDTTFARSLLSSNYPAELIEPVVKIITSILIFSVVIGLIIGFIIPAFLVVGGFKLNKVYMNIAESESGS